MNNHANKTSFKPGLIPWNKGMKGWRAPGSGQKALEEGAIKVRIDKGGKNRRWIKRNGKWIIYATDLWVRKRGPIPNGFFIHHVDGNTMHDDLENYAVVSHKLHMVEHRKQLQKAKIRNGLNVGRGYAYHPVLSEWVKNEASREGRSTRAIYDRLISGKYPDLKLDLG